MDILQISLVFLIVLLGTFLSITGVQAFLILRDLKKTLDNINKVLYKGEEKVSSKKTKQSKSPRFFRSR